MAWTFGSEYVFNSANTNNTKTCQIDSTHFVVIYRDNGSSGYGTAIIGTISNDDEVSYGTEYVFRSGGFNYLDVIALSSTKLVIAYQRSNNIYCKIATISNDDELTFGSEYSISSVFLTSSFSLCKITTSSFSVSYLTTSTYYGKTNIGIIDNTTITFGSSYIFSSSLLNTEPGNISSCLLDSTHLAISYSKYFEGGLSKGYSSIGIIANDDELTFGSEYEFSSISSTKMISICVIDSTNFFIAYKTSNRGKAVIATISNDDEISYGTIYDFQSSNSASWISCIKIDSTHCAIVYKDDGNSGYGTFIKANISGSTISFDSSIVFNSGSSDYTSSCLLDSTHIAVGYVDIGNSSYGTAIIAFLADIILQFDATIDYSLDYSFPLSSILETTALLNYDIDYPSSITGSSSFNSIIDYDYSYFILGQEKYISPITIEYDYDIIVPMNAYDTIPVVIEYDYDILATSDGSGKIDAIIDYDYDWASWYEWDGRENRSYSSIRLVNSSYSIGKKQDNRNSKAQITASGLTPAQLQSLANTIPTLEDSKQSRGK